MPFARSSGPRCSPVAGSLCSGWSGLWSCHDEHTQPDHPGAAAQHDATAGVALSIADLAALLNEAVELKADAKRVSDLLHDALHLRFGAAAAALRRAEGKDTGRVRLEQDGFEIVADLAKKVDWQQSRLADAVSTLRTWGEDPADYVATELRVPEARFTAWPPRIRALFEPARTVATGRPSYALQPKDPA